MVELKHRSKKKLKPLHIDLLFIFMLLLKHFLYIYMYVIFLRTFLYEVKQVSTIKTHQLS